MSKQHKIEMAIPSHIMEAIAVPPVEYLRKWWTANSTEEERVAAEERDATIEGAYAFIEDFCRRAKHKGQGACLPDQATYDLCGVFMRVCRDGDVYATAEEIAKDEADAKKREESEAKRKAEAKKWHEAAEKKEAERIARDARIYARRQIRKLLADGKIGPRFSIVIPNTETEMINEGHAMGNCVGDYWHGHGWRTGECQLAFIRKNGKPYIDVEIREGKIIQARYKGNIDVPEATKDYKVCEVALSAFRKAA